MIKDLLELVGQHPKIVIASLFAIIVVAGTGGGVWINTLLSQVKSADERTKIANERIIVANERIRSADEKIELALEKYKKREENCAHENFTLRRQFGIIEEYALTLSETIVTITSEINYIDRNKYDRRQIIKMLEKSTALLDYRLDELIIALNRVHDITDLSEDMRAALSSPLERSLSPEPLLRSMRALPNGLYLIAALCFIVVIVLLVLYVRRMRKN